MKLTQSIQTKQTTKLFNGKYKYKIVLVTKTASWFRGANFDHVKAMASVVDMSTHAHWARSITDDEKEYAVKLANAMQKMCDFLIRVESPYINFYTNIESDVEKLAKIGTYNVKYVSMPAPGSEANLEDKKIIVKNLDYDYRVTMGRTRQNYNNFLQWCLGKDKVKLTKRASSQLAKEHSWGGYYFYVKDEKSLTMVKMFLSSNIHNVERCVKQ
jgi:hypothetical protein